MTPPTWLVKVLEVELIIMIGVLTCGVAPYLAYAFVRKLWKDFKRSRK
jgi:hypothetical protein